MVSEVALANNGNLVEKNHLLFLSNNVFIDWL